MKKNVWERILLCRVLFLLFGVGYIHIKVILCEEILSAIEQIEIMGRNNLKIDSSFKAH